MHILQSLLGEVLPALLLETIRETIREAADNFLRLRQEKKKKEQEEEEVADAAGAVRARQQESERERNPFLRLLRELLDEAADGLVRAAVCAAVLEEVLVLYAAAAHCSILRGSFIVSSRIPSGGESAGRAAGGGPGLGPAGGGDGPDRRRGVLSRREFGRLRPRTAHAHAPPAASARSALLSSPSISILSRH